MKHSKKLPLLDKKIKTPNQSLTSSVCVGEMKKSSQSEGRRRKTWNLTTTRTEGKEAFKETNKKGTETYVMRNYGLVRLGRTGTQNARQNSMSRVRYDQ